MPISLNDSTPLLAEFHPNRLISVAADVELSQAEFLYTVNALAQLLPDNKYFINLCQQRYSFLLAFCAVIIKGGTNILPPNRNLATIEQIKQEYPQAVCIRSEAESQFNVSDDVLLTALLAQITQQKTRLFSAELCEFSSENPLINPLIKNEHIIAITYTSGSTGHPKPNKKTWQLLSGTASLLSRRFLGADTNTVIIPTVPPQHMYGLEASIMLVLQGRCILYAGDTFYPQDIAEAFCLVGHGILITTPVHLLTLNKSAVAITGIDKVICSTAPLKQQLGVAIEEQYATKIEEIYGFTEAGSVATRRPTVTEEWLLLDDMNLERQDGGWVVNGPQFVTPVSVLDVIELLHQGRNFRLCGRAEDLLNVAGKRASLADLNFKLVNIEGVRDAVLFLPEEVNDVTRPLALVVSDLNKRDILQAFAKLVDPLFIPRPLIFVEQIPRNETGKPQRLELLKIVDAYERRRP